MNFNQMKKIREIRAASFGQVFGLLVLLSGFIGSTGFRVESGAEVSLLGEQIIDYVEVRQSGFMDLTVESPKENFLVWLSQTHYCGFCQGRLRGDPRVTGDVCLPDSVFVDHLISAEFLSHP